MEDEATSVSPRYLSGEYLDRNDDWHERDAPWKASQVGEIMAANSVLPRSICDIGCGTGGVLESLSHAVPSGTQLVGYEPSPQAALLVTPERRERIEFVTGTHDTDERSFDLLLCLDVFEHVEDYYGLLRSIRSKAPLAIFHIPIDTALTTLISPMPLKRSLHKAGHIHHYTAPLALQCLEYSGYTVLDWHRTNPAARTIEGRTSRQRFGTAARRVGASVNINLAGTLMTGFPLLVLAQTNS